MCPYTCRIKAVMMKDIIIITATSVERRRSTKMKCAALATLTIQIQNNLGV